MYDFERILRIDVDDFEKEEKEKLIKEVDKRLNEVIDEYRKYLLNGHGTSY